MSDHVMSSRLLRFRPLFVTWLAVYPTVTVLIWLLAPHLGDLPLPAQTLVITVAMMPILNAVMLPLLQRLVPGRRSESG